MPLTYLGGKLKVVESPDVWEGIIRPSDTTLERGVFLAGGITGCEDWQDELITTVDKLRGFYPVWNKVTLINPRRTNFPMDDPDAAFQQILWERIHLNLADVISFWFPKETLCPITLFELGAALHSGKKTVRLIIGADPEYKRREDVVIQSALAGWEGKVHDNLNGVAEEICSVWRETLQ